MIKIRFELHEINYEKSIESLITQLIGECRKKANPNEVEKLITRLGGDTIQVANKLIGFMDTDTRDQIIVWLIESQRDIIVSSLNKAMHDALGSDAVVIGDLYAQDEPGTKIALNAVRVKTDSKQLVESPALTGIGGGVAKLAFWLTDSETIEKEGVKLLSSEYVKPKLISTLSDGLHEAGLSITLEDIVIEEDSGKDEIPRMTDPEKDEGMIPDALEDKIIDAFVAWLRGMIKC